MNAWHVVFLLALVVALGVALRFRRRWEQSEQARVRELSAERERHAAAEQAHRARMEAILDGMIEGLVVLNRNGRIAQLNRAAEVMFRCSRTMVGGSVLETLRIHEVAAFATQVASSQNGLQHEIRVEGSSPRTLLASGAALRDPAGELAGVVLVFHDVTRLRELEGTRQDFVANVSHELRTPLSLIKSTVETLLDGGPKPADVTTRFLEIIDKHTNRLALLMDDLLLLAQLDSGRLELRRTDVALAPAVDEAIEDARLRAKTRRVSLENRVPPALIADADPDRLHQVLGNLLDNAIKYGRLDGQVIVRGRALDAQRVELSVRDDGPGIPPEALPRLFERFFRVDKARSREHGGTGLGLAIVKNVVQAHGGEVRVESVLGQGAEFIITLPAAPAGAVETA